MNMTVMDQFRALKTPALSATLDGMRPKMLGMRIGPSAATSDSVSSTLYLVASRLSEGMTIKEAVQWLGRIPRQREHVVMIATLLAKADDAIIADFTVLANFIESERKARMKEHEAARVAATAAKR